MSVTRFDVRFELEGWSLLAAWLEAAPAPHGALAALRRQVADRAREQLRIDTLAQHPAVAALRKLFRAAGTDPTRYRPSSEALVRRLLKGADLPAISPLVDLNNALSATLVVPCCVMDTATVSSPFVLRAGLPNEAYASLRGPFKLAGRPVLADAAGPCDTPITGSMRVKVMPEAQHAWLVAYLPSDAVTPEAATAALESLLEVAPVARVAHAFVCAPTA